MTVNELIALYTPTDSAPPLLAFNGLDQVDWSVVQDAYGPAVKVPALLRALVSAKPEHREFADLLLCQTIWHQGSVRADEAEAFLAAAVAIIRWADGRL